MYSCSPTVKILIEKKLITQKKPEYMYMPPPPPPHLKLSSSQKCILRVLQINQAHI